MGRHHFSENRTSFAGSYHSRNCPGFGRWTAFLAGFCERLIVVDIGKVHFRMPRDRFRDVAHIEYHVNDGRSLPFAHMTLWTLSSALIRSSTSTPTTSSLTSPRLHGS